MFWGLAKAFPTDFVMNLLPRTDIQTAIHGCYILCYTCGVVKKVKRQFNARLKEETVFAIQELAERWGCSQAEVVERVVSETPVPPRAGTVRMPEMVAGQTHWEIGVLGHEPSLRAEPTDDPREFRVVDNRPKNCFCKHCGERFAGAKYASICQGCKSSGHTLTPNECPICMERGTGAI